MSNKYISIFAAISFLFLSGCKNSEENPVGQIKGEYRVNFETQQFEFKKESEIKKDEKIPMLSGVLIDGKYFKLVK